MKSAIAKTKIAIPIVIALGLVTYLGFVFAITHQIRSGSYSYTLFYLADVHVGENGVPHTDWSPNDEFFSDLEYQEVVDNLLAKGCGDFSKKAFSGYLWVFPESTDIYYTEVIVLLEENYVQLSAPLEENKTSNRTHINILGLEFVVFNKSFDSMIANIRKNCSPETNKGETPIGEDAIPYIIPET